MAWVAAVFPRADCAANLAWTSCFRRKPEGHQPSGQGVYGVQIGKMVTMVFSLKKARIWARLDRAFFSHDGARNPFQLRLCHSDDSSLNFWRQTLLPSSCRRPASCSRAVRAVLVGFCRRREKPAAMAQPAVAADLHQALDVHGDLSAQVALHLEVVVDIIAQGADLVFGKILDARIGVDAGGGDDLVRGRCGRCREYRSERDL